MPTTPPLSRKGLRFVGEVEEQGTAGQPTPAADHTAAVPRQTINYCRSRDGVRLAYATVGSGPRLLKAANWRDTSRWCAMTRVATGCRIGTSTASRSTRG